MPAPTGSVTFDKASYRPGERITATVVRSDADSRTYTFDTTATDAAGNTGHITGTFVVSDPVTVGQPTDDGNRTWTAGPDDGATATFTATA
jgi:hypothetical protein